tara:strand:+ start:109 stop:321 length:213 start_codon:yes stop_codon:yes gene_type:complete
MVCGLIEIPLAVLAAVAAVATAITALSETLPFLSKYSANGILHAVYHLVHPNKCTEESIPEAQVAAQVLG